MYTALADLETSRPSNHGGRVRISSSSKQPHIFEQLRWRTRTDYSYKEIELPTLDPSTSSTTHDRQRISKRKRFWKDTKDELKTVQWSEWSSRFLAFVLPVVLMILLLNLIVWICFPGNLFDDSDVCQPDGTFYFGLGSYKPWHTEGLFQIDVGFGRLSFTNAKLIDFWWDLLVGRGGQVLMSYVAYKACTKSLIRHMEVHAVPTETFEAITIQDHNMTGLVKLLNGLAANRDARSIATMVWFVIGCGYVLLFPSFVSAMSGYSANVQAYIEVASGSLVPWSDFGQVRYIIHDGERLGGKFYDDYAVVVPKDTTGLTGSDSDWGDCFISSTYDSSGNYLRGVLDAGASPGCELLWNTAVYGTQSGYLGLNKSSSTFNSSGHIIKLDAPTLNISAYFGWPFTASEYPTTASLSSDSYYNPGFYWKNPQTGNYTFGDIYNPMLTYDNKTYSGTQIEDLGRCQQTTVYYKWGFSFLLLFSLLVSLLVWCIGMYATYMDAYLHSRLDPTRRHLGLQRATLDLASAMDPYITKEQSDTMSNSKVNELIAGCTISYAHLVSGSILSPRGERLKAKWRAFRFKKWVRADKWWFALAVIVFLLWCQSWYPIAFLPPFIADAILLSGLGLMLYAGPASKARWVIFVVSGSLFGLLTGLALSGRVYGLFYWTPLFWWFEMRLRAGFYD